MRRSSSLSPVGKKLRSDISLRQFESEIFDLIRTVAGPLEMTVRVAGGWVRDKLLLQDSHDIDFAVDKPPSVLIEALKHHCRDVLKQPDMISSTGTVVANAEKGKNVQAETFMLMGRPIDVVALRCRDKQVATPEEDVLMRDFTVNALFYNVCLEKIEDFLPNQIGLQDLLINRLVRTPIDATQTFLDDPLRAIRAIRIARKLGFEIDDEIVNAQRNPMVRKKLEMVSRERFGIEVVKMIEGPDPLGCFELISKWDLFNIVFRSDFSTAAEDCKDDFDVPSQCSSSLRRFYKLQTELNFPSNLSIELRKVLLLSAFLMPLHKDVLPLKSKHIWTVPRDSIANKLKVNISRLEHQI